MILTLKTLELSSCTKLEKDYRILIEFSKRNRKLLYVQYKDYNRQYVKEKRGENESC